MYVFARKKLILHFIYYAGVAAYKYGCGEKGKKEADGCKSGKISVNCYCTGTKCKHCNPTDKNDKSCKNGKSSANTIFSLNTTH